MKNKFLFGMIALLSVSLVFMGCPQAADQSSNAELTSVLEKTITTTGTGTLASPKTAAITLADAIANGAVKASDIVASAKANAKLYSDSEFETEATETGITLTAGETTGVYILVTAEDGTDVYYKISIALPKTITAQLDGTVGTNYTTGLSVDSAIKLDSTITIVVKGTNITSGLGTDNENDFQFVSGTKGNTGKYALVKIAAAGFYDSFDKSAAHIEWQQGPSLAGYEETDEAWPPANYTTFYKELTDETALSNLNTYGTGSADNSEYQNYGVYGDTVYWKTSAGVYNKASNIGASDYSSVTARRIVLLKQTNATDQVSVFRLRVDSNVVHTVKIDYSGVTWSN